MEQRETIETNLLTQVAEIFKIPVEAIENLDEEQAVNIISNTFNNNDIGIMTGHQKNENCTFHPIDKLVQLHEEKIALYERMLKEKDEIMARLEKLIESK